MKAQVFLDYVKETKSKNTYKEYKFGLEKFCEWFGRSADEILELRKQDVISDDPMQKRRFAREIEKFHAHLLKKYKINSARTICLGILQLFSFFEMPVKIRKQSKVSKTVVTTRDFPLSPNHLKKMYAVADLRERMLLCVAKDLGWRIGDFVEIRKDELPSLKEEPPILFEKVTEKEEMLAKSFLSRETVKLLKTYLPTLSSENPYLFQSNHGSHLDKDSINRIVKDLVKKARIEVPKKKRVRFHAFRKLFLSTCANLSVDPNMAKLMVGKSVDKSMLTYLNGVEYRKAFEKVSEALAVSEPVETTAREREEILVNMIDDQSRKIKEIETLLSVKTKKIESLEKEVKEKPGKDELRELFDEIMGDYLKDPEKRKVFGDYFTEAAIKTDLHEEYKNQAYDFIQTHVGVVPEKVSYYVYILGKKAIIDIKGYWFQGKYVKVPQPAQILIPQ